MSLDYAILGFLQYRPLSGYGIKKLLDALARHCWPADQSQIYRTLGRLEERGWAHQQVIAQKNRPNRREFHITEGGRRELLRWLAGPTEPAGNRSAALLKIFFAGQLPEEQILAGLERAAEALSRQLEGYAGIPRRVESHQEMAGSCRESFFWLLTVECRVAAARAELEWLHSAIRRIRAGDYTHLPNAWAPVPDRQPGAPLL